MTIEIELLGWAGALAVLVAYALLSLKKLASDSYAYHGLNILGSFLLGIYAICKDASASLLVNAVWLVIGVIAVFALYRSRHVNRKI